jgi:hypothetical protein
MTTYKNYCGFKVPLLDKNFCQASGTNICLKTCMACYSALMVRSAVAIQNSSPAEIMVIGSYDARTGRYERV